MIRLDEAAANPAAGAKAQTLARARSIGLPVPDGIVLLPEEEIDARDLALALAALAPASHGARFAVRSSADVEDRPEASAAGIFESEIDVPAERVAAAAQRVRDSGQREVARAYLASRGIARAKVAVLIQPMVDGASALGVLHTAPLDGDRMIAEERAPTQPEWGEVTARSVDRAEALGAGALRLAALVGGEADIEYALTDGGPRFLQARPLAAPPPRDAVEWDPGDAGAWRRDAEHNADPLSAAQASLVPRGSRLAGVPRMTVLNGYLYYALEKPSAATVTITPAELPRRFAEEIAPACEALLSPLEAGPAPPLDRALEVYLAVLERYIGQVSPAIARARAHLDQLLQANLGDSLEQHGELLSGTGAATVARDAALHRIGRADPAERPALIAEYGARYGAWAPAWDVVVPCDDELPTRILAAASLLARGASPESRHATALVAAESAARALLERLDRMARGAFKHLLPVVREAVAIAEADDALFFRAQRLMRRALLGVGMAALEAAELSDPTLIFELPIDAALAGDLDESRARDARLLRAQRRALSPPSEIHAGRPTVRGGGGGAVLRGRGTRGRGYGPAFILRDTANAPASIPPGAVLVTAAILPSLTFLLPGAAALVTDHGGALSHGATLAREYGVPAVLGTGRATELLTDGEELIVDADAGRVFRMR